MGDKRARQEPDDAKLRELILYICERSEGDPAFGAMKLNKLLFLADFTSYLRRGRAITGQEYQALAQGPAPRRLVRIRDDMKRSGEIAVREEDFYGRRQQRTLALRPADLAAFTADEIDLVDRLLQAWWGRSAADISEASHRFLGWRLAEEGETIPYAVALVDAREPTAAEREVGRKLESVAAECLAQHVG